MSHDPAAAADPPCAVTVIVPAYNAERYLARTLESLLAQRGVDFRIIVVDDHSTDGTSTIVRAHAARDDRVGYSCTTANFGGPAGPRNQGVAQATSEWVAFCDADDLWHPDKLRAQLECARRSGAALICSKIEVFANGPEPNMAASPMVAAAPSRPIGLLSSLFKNRVATSSVLCRRAPILAAGGFNVDRSMVAVEDYDLWLRLMTSHGVGIERVEQKLVAYRVLPGSLSASKWRQALKIMRVHRSVFVVKGWQFLFPLAAPVLISCYITSWLYLRRKIVRLPS